jgi:hypothetical protein
MEVHVMDRFLNEMNLTQLITSPTRITDSTQSLLDVILVSSKSIVYTEVEYCLHQSVTIYYSVC